MALTLDCNVPNTPNLIFKFKGIRQMKSLLKLTLIFCSIVFIAGCEIKRYKADNEKLQNVQSKFPDCEYAIVLPKNGGSVNCFLVRKNDGTIISVYCENYDDVEITSQHIIFKPIKTMKSDK